MHDVTTLDCSRIAQDLQIRKVQVENVVRLLDEGNTVPFISRYRKERTGGLDEETIRQVQVRVRQARQLADRKQTILKSIEGQGKLTGELRSAIEAADTSKRLEDLYVPYKAKKRSPATTARERGLEPLARAVWYRDAAVANLDEILPAFVNPEHGLATPADVRAGVQHILAEVIAEIADVRAVVRSLLWESGKICAGKHEKLADGQGLEYKDYFQFTESLRQIPPHRILALNRGEKEQALKIAVQWDGEAVKQAAVQATAEYALRKCQEWQDKPVEHALVAAAGAMPPAAPITEPPPAEAAPSQPGAENASATTPASAEEPSAVASTVAPPAVDGEQDQAAQTPAAETPAPAGANIVPSAEGPRESKQSAAPPFALPDPCPLPADVGEPVSTGSTFRTPHAAFLLEAIDEALKHVLLPALQREIRQELTAEAEAHAVGVFGRNLHSLLLQRPLRNKRVLAMDPGFRTGCKVAVLDEAGNLLEDALIYSHSKKGKQRSSQATGAPSTDAAAGAGAGAVPAESTAPAPTPEITIGQAVSVQSPTSWFPGGVAPIIVGPGLDAPTVVPLAGTAQTSGEPPSPSKKDQAKLTLEELVRKHQVQVVAIGSGPGCRQLEELVAELIACRLPDLSYIIVNEAGASVYAVSAVGREELPDFDPGLRGAISIGRRLQDPLSELVKVDPQNIGVGLYQHDVRRRELKESLDAVVESCVNHVGVDVNTAGVPLLRYVSGLNALVAREIVEYRKKQGPFKNREQLLQLPGLGASRFSQAAGFLKVQDSDNPLDDTWIHPESYGLAQKILAELGYGPDILHDKARRQEFLGKMRDASPEDLSARLGAGVPTVADILDDLANPGLDPRDDRPLPAFRKGILKINDLQPGMELKGTVLNVVDFGAFVDVGLKDSGLVHISQMANRYIRSPYEVVSAHDVVTVWVLSVDKERNRVSLTMIKPGTERKPGERSPRREGQRGRRPPAARHDGAAGPEQREGEQGPGAQERRGRPRRRGRSHGRGPAPGQAPGHAPGQPPAGAPAQGAPASAGERGAAPARQGPPPRPGQPPRRPRRETPPPQLTAEALEGKVPLRTFSELSALFAAKTREPSPAPPQVAEPVPAVAEAQQPTAAETTSD